MKIVFYLSLLTFYLLSAATTNAQEASGFPVTGVYKLVAGTDSGKDFNEVDIRSNTFSLNLNGREVRSYQIVSEIKGGFSVEQIVHDDARQEKFNVTIDEINESECFVTIHYAGNSEKIRLKKQ